MVFPLGTFSFFYILLLLSGPYLRISFIFTKEMKNRKQKNLKMPTNKRVFFLHFLLFITYRLLKQVFRRLQIVAIVFFSFLLFPTVFLSFYFYLFFMLFTILKGVCMQSIFWINILI